MVALISRAYVKGRGARPILGLDKIVQREEDVATVCGAIGNARFILQQTAARQQYQQAMMFPSHEKVSRGAMQTAVCGAIGNARFILQQTAARQ